MIGNQETDEQKRSRMRNAQQEYARQLNNQQDNVRNDYRQPFVHDNYEYKPSFLLNENDNKSGSNEYQKSNMKTYSNLPISSTSSTKVNFRTRGGSSGGGLSSITF